MSYQSRKKRWELLPVSFLVLSRKFSKNGTYHTFSPLVDYCLCNVVRSKNEYTSNHRIGVWSSNFDPHHTVRVRARVSTTKRLVNQPEVVPKPTIFIFLFRELTGSTKCRIAKDYIKGVFVNSLDEVLDIWSVVSHFM